MKKLELTIASNYVPTWTVVDAVRELFQNALDQGDYTWHFAAGTLTLTNCNTSLSTSSLLLGTSTKAGDLATVGQFGEGYKIATLVLLRSGKQVGHAVGADGLHDVGAHAAHGIVLVVTKWRFHLRCSFFIEEAPRGSQVARHGCALRQNVGCASAGASMPVKLPRVQRHCTISRKLA